jgi:hypothetical protein
MDDTKDYREDPEFKEFVGEMIRGLNAGAAQYGDDGFLKRDVINMAAEEVRDLACYAFMLYKKLKMIRIKMLTEIKEERRANSDRT